ncbi:hypothetical protein N7468_004281 [Penicillium chermesinum]|uniref:UTP23 sensor motif region domain-containing protein n=1 Tax=Penicillium chermesinum TaxID=63820 RepID=A0A9W9TSL5_9EURO|nr:uncharacterized protein N7468_004281 [Penicillium chermesinum]KAJ5239662.1 hypothetical protein N7468_004281 [Penicillium chermesinum]
MRAKRSKKYRKLMQQYELTFGFREPYQVLVDSNFLAAIHAFKMDLIPALERTLQGKPKPLLTKCSLAAIMAAQPINPKTNQPYHSTPIDEVECLLSLLSPGSGPKKNKEHYTLATADPPTSKKNDKNDSQQRKRKRDDEREEEKALRRARALRAGARSIPGVPVIYVKRSVMVLEPMSTPSETIREDHENSKFRVGLDDQTINAQKPEPEERKKIPGLKKAKGPNPLSVKKKKKKADAPAPAQKKPKVEESRENADDEEGAAKPKRRRRHHKSGPRGEGDGDAAGPAAEAPETMQVEE